VSLSYLHDLGSVLAHKIELMIAGSIVSLTGIAVPTIAPTFAQREILDLSKMVITWGDVSAATGWICGVTIWYYSVIKIRLAIKEHKLNIEKTEKELGQ